MSVTLHRGFSSAGKSQAFARNKRNLNDTRIGNNKARSVTLTKDSKVVLFRKKDYKGPAVWIRKSVGNLESVPIGKMEVDFDKKAKSMIVKPLTIPVSVKVITKNGKLPGGYKSLAKIESDLDGVIEIQNNTTWKNTLIKFEILDVYKVGNKPEFFSFNYDKKVKMRSELRRIQQDPNSIDLYIVDNLVNAGGFATSVKGKEQLGCCLTAKNINKWDGRKLSHEFGHHLGLSHNEKSKINLMTSGVNENKLTIKQINIMHEIIANDMKKYNVKY